MVECPRDAMQGWKNFIPTTQKIAYLNLLLKVGFDVLDFGSFVSEKAVPQMADTREVVEKLDLEGTKTRLLSIIANKRGAEVAVSYDQIHYLGYPFSVSETFQIKNTNKTILESVKEVEAIQNLCIQHKKELVVYISMGFGNPYGDPYNAAIVLDWIGKLNQLGVRTIAVADTVGLATPADVNYIFSSIIPEFRDISFGAHFHSTPDLWEEKFQAAFDQGCRRFDSALNGIGGCPMAGNDLVGNMATENIIDWCDLHQVELPLDRARYQEALVMASRIFI
jgi:hydroxymethylglutaryl-CoA lyase